MALPSSQAARSPVGGGLPVHSHELTDLYLVRRTWAGKKMAMALGARMLGAKLRSQDLVSNGAALQGRLLEIILREGIPIQPSTPVHDLVVENGRVVGVQIGDDSMVDTKADAGADAGNSNRIIRARDGVLLNAGGFSRNEAMRQSTGRKPATAQWTATNPGDTGEMLPRSSHEQPGAARSARERPEAPRSTQERAGARRSSH